MVSEAKEKPQQNKGLFSGALCLNIGVVIKKVLSLLRLELP